MPMRVAMVSAELATAVFSGLGWYVQVSTNFLPRRSRVPRRSCSASTCASSWQGWVIVSMLITGTVRVLREALQHLVLAVVLPVDELREGAHADQVDVAAEHPRDLGDVLLGLAVHHRAEVELDRPRVLARLQHHRVAAELEGAELEAGARAQRRVEEHQRDRLALERVAQLVALEQRGLRQQRVELGAAPVLGVQEMLMSVGPGMSIGKRWPSCRVRKGSTKTKKPSARLGCPVKRTMTSGRPSWSEDSGRRAREVMPEAMRAERQR